jgi:hypothetical protein
VAGIENEEKKKKGIRKIFVAIRKESANLKGSDGKAAFDTH